MQRAVFLARLEGALPAGYERLYFGSEFCSWSFPALSEVEKALDEAHRRGLGFTLATPVLSEAFLPCLREVVARIGPRLRPGDEILISDWGALRLVREILPAVPLILGRVLSGQKRGAQILTLDLSPAAQAYFQQGAWYSAEACTLLDELNIHRIELDNLLQGIAALPAGLCGSLHFPYLFVTSTRSCPWREPGALEPCPAPCGEVFGLRSPREPLPMLQCGNTQFVRHEHLPAAPETLGIDRLVYHPRLPR
ncbi:hypothetical protein [Geoalkalibacter halelectricus]|uniref:Peptidase family U32 n=1 Tax=Geoalkalibacter halelectricus TaxID=2847045 RepID=A0ABY5ZTG2_9BACT|nr:hypothetical protein [Geoalkalibacter halelectricus]MDO3377025.1 hypothetical protein [Geoalkalibacter halelectricus]UWZ81247.1 hypothetical protein L9S41_07615 [Geoalkalibacter halelectricus]